MSKRLIIAAVIFSILLPVAAILKMNTGTSFLWLIPPALMLILFAILSVENFLMLTVFLVPLSVQLRFIIPETSFDLFLPTELMLAVILVIMLIKTMTGEISLRLLRHPVTILILLSLLWGIITALTGTMPVVSLKSIATRLWFIAAFYILAAEIFTDTGKVRKYFGAYIAGMTPVALFFLFEMIKAGGFNQSEAYAASRPFFNDHTSFGAAVAFCIPLLVFFISGKQISFQRRLLIFLLLLIFCSVFILSYSRAAWISLFISGLFTIVVLSRVSWKIIIPGAVIALAAIIIMWQPVMMKLEENRQDSSGELPQHIRSISNITTDASNMERINKWNSALRMFRERPLFGWGPATFQFNYGPFQMAGEKTFISSTFGEAGNAHSEYLGSLAESGIPGALLYLILLAAVFGTGLRVFYKAGNREERILILTMLAGLMTYVVHGGLNSFLDTDKISALFWGMTAVIVAVDIKKNDIKGT